MLTFETQLDKLKHLVLKEVAILAREERLTKEELEKIPYAVIQGDKAQYRCCVYKERAIVYERAQLAAGCLPNDDARSSLVDVKGDGQIIYVISAACDSCPIERFTVTEACRGCLTHKCADVCPAQAISRVNGRSYINHDACKECGLCKKSCPYNAIAEVARPCKRSCPTGALTINPEDRKAVINSSGCINCGACMAVCPFGAISDKSYIVNVVRALNEGKRLYAVVAPSIAGQFGPKVNVGQIKTGLKKMGFNEMVEAACGADAVTVHEGNEFAERMEKGDKYMTNSCCTGFLNYIEYKFKDQVDRISGTVSPMVATGRMIKNEDKDAVVVFIGPCTAKKNEATKEGLKDAVDYVITFEELSALFAAYEIDPEICSSEDVEDASLYGRGFAQKGGLTAAIENYVSDKGIEVEFKPVRVSGSVEIKRAMTMAKAGKLDGNFIEGMMCEGGCIAGPAVHVNPMKTKALLNRFNNESSKKDVLKNDNLEKFEGVNLER